MLLPQIQKSNLGEDRGGIGICVLYPGGTSKGIIAGLIRPPKAPPAVRGPNPSSFCSLVRERRQ